MLQELGVSDDRSRKSEEMQNRVIARLDKLSSNIREWCRFFNRFRHAFTKQLERQHCGTPPTLLFLCTIVIKSSVGSGYTILRYPRGFRDKEIHRETHYPPQRIGLKSLKTDQWMLIYELPLYVEEFGTPGWRSDVEFVHEARLDLHTPNFLLLSHAVFKTLVEPQVFRQ